MTLQEFYEQVGGSYDNVMGRLMSEERIVKYLGKFLSCTDYDEMVKAFAEKRYRDAFLHSHTLKGTALNLGLDRLASAASDLCELVRSSDPESVPPVMLQRAEDEFKAVQTLIQKMQNNG